MPKHEASESRKSDSAIIPTLTERYLPQPATGNHVDSLIDEISEELKASLHQQLYQAMTVTLHQIVNKENTQLKDKIRSQLQHQLPAIIKLANSTIPRPARK